VYYRANVIGPEGHPVLGLSEFLNNRIYVATSFQGKAIAEEVIEHTFFHEVSHFMMYLMNRQDLNQDEAFVDVLGGLMAQFVKTMK
jgi:predicted SprT family Zn-dependent metalloprotease